MKIPLILWGKTPPSHSITCITRCYYNSRIMTGSIEGQIGCWDIIYNTQQDKYQIQPFCIIFAHNCSIDDICLLSNKRMGINSFLVSLSNSGELCLWNSENGCCLNTTYVNAKFDKIYGIYGRNADIQRQSLIICYGTHPDMQILDPFSLEILFTLKQNCAWPNFISTLCFFPASGNLMAVTYSGMVKTWEMCDAFQKNKKSHVIKDSNQYNLALQPDCIVRHIVPNLTSNKHFLLVTSKQFFIYDSTKIIRLISTPIQLQQSWAGGNFLGNNMVIMWDKNGICYLFAISNDECQTVFDSPLLYAIFHTDQSEIGLSVTMLNHPHGNMDCFVIFQGCIGGRITYWRLPIIDDLKRHVSLWCEQINEMSEILEEQGYENAYQQVIDDHVAHMQATCTTGLNDTFAKAQPPNIINKIDNADENPVCCSIFLTETGFIAAGRTNGNITLIPALQALCFEFLHNNNDPNSNYDGNEFCNLVGHSKKITYLFYPYDENDHYQPYYLLSGSADFTVRLWNIITLTQLSCFCYHAGVITKILPVPATSNSLLGSSIVTMGSDHTVNVINIDSGKHIVQANSNNSPVQAVKWRIEEDLMLLGCGDGIIYIWQLSTGKLDRCVSGSLALEILEAFNDDSEISYHSTALASNNSSTTSLSSEKSRTTETKISRVASSFATKFSKSHQGMSKEKVLNLRFHRHHLHSNHHIHLSSLKKSKVKRRSFKLKSLNSVRVTYRSERNIKDCEQRINNEFTHKSSSTNISRADSRIFDITTTTLNMASQPLTNIQSTSAINLNCPKNDSTEECFGVSNDSNITMENVSHTTNQYLPFNIISARTSYQNDDIHVLLFDPDAVIRTIHYLEETLKSITNLRVCYLKKYNSVSTDGFQSKPRLQSAFDLSSMNYHPHDVNNGDKNGNCLDSQNYSRMKTCFKYLSLAVAPPNNISDYSKYLAKHTYYHSRMIRDTITILVSALSAWGLDKQLDNMCEKRLHLNPPVTPICFGLISYGKLVAQLPIHNPSDDVPNTASNNILKQSVVKHWSSSKTMLTQHIVTIASVARAVLGAESSFLMDYVLSYSRVDSSDCNQSQQLMDSNRKSDTLKCGLDNSINSNSSASELQSQNSINILKTNNEKSRFFKKTISYDSNDLIASIKSDWSELANFYCFKITKTLLNNKNFHFRGVTLHELIRHWLSFNSDIREASRSILLSELNHLGVDHALNLIRAWGYFLLDNTSFYDYIHSGNTSDQITVSYPGIQNNLVIESSGSYGYWPTPVHHRATLALYMISFVICELFISQPTKDLNLITLNRILPSSKLEDIAKLLVESISLSPNQKIHYPTPTKRASIWLIGRGFQVFEEYIDFTKLIITLLDITATSEIIMKYHNSKQPRASKIEYTKAYDTWSTAHSTLVTIATLKPTKFLNTIDSDIIKNISSTNLICNISASSTNAIHMYNIYINNYNRKMSSHYQNEIDCLNDNLIVESNNLNILSIGAIFKKEIFQILNRVFVECYDEISPRIIEIFDMALQCLNPKVFKGKASELIERSKMFSSPIVNYNEFVKKLAVGTKQGKIALFDVRTLKLSQFLAHDSEISFISFSKDGKYLVSFSKIDCHLKTWHSQFSLIGLINNPFKQHNSYLITHPDGYDRLLECLPTFEWNDSRHIIIHLDQNQFSFVV